MLCAHNEPYVSKHRCVGIVDICAIQWGEKEHKSSSEKGPLEMQDGLNAVALINAIVLSLMMYHGTEPAVRNPAVSPPRLQHAALHWRGRVDPRQNPAHCHPVEKSCQRAPIPSYNHFDLLFTPTLCFISAI